MRSICRLEVRGPAKAEQPRQASHDGTAWAVSEDLLATAFHVVGRAEVGWLADTQGVSYWAVDDQGEIELEPVACDLVADVAVLRPRGAAGASPREGWRPLAVGEWSVGPGASWEAGGFAQIAAHLGVTLHGKVKTVRSDSSDHSLELFVAEGSGSSWAGASGSPVLVGGRVVGVLTNELTHGATLFGAEIESVLRLLRLHERWDLVEECRRILRSLQGDSASPNRAEPGDAGATATAERAARFGPRGLLELLGRLPPESTAALRRDMLLCALAPAREGWPRRHGAGEFGCGQAEHDGQELSAGLRCPEPLAKAWHRFLRRRPWHERVEEALRELGRAMAKVGSKPAFQRRVSLLVDAFATLGLERDDPLPAGRAAALTGYRRARADLKQVLGEPALREPAKAVSSVEAAGAHAEAVTQRARALAELEKLADEPFGRCFFLMGGSGSGKSHFIDTAMRASARDDSAALVLPLGACPQGPITRASVEALLAERLLKATGRTFEGLGEFQEAILAAGRSQLAFLESLNPNGRGDEPSGPLAGLPRVVVALDGFERWLSPDPATAVATCEVFEQLVDEHCRGPAIHWLFTLRDTRYDRLSLPAEGPSFWEQYSGVDLEGRCWDDPASTGPSARLPAKAGWIVLDEAHKAAGTGFDILAEHVGEETVRRAREASHGAASDYLWQPWFACVLCRLDRPDCERVLDTGDLRYVALVELVRNARIATLDGSLEGRKRTDRHMRILAGLLLPGGGRIVRDGRLDAAAQQVAARLRYPCREAEFSAALDLLVFSELLRETTDEQLRIQVEVELEFLWSYECAWFLLVQLEERAAPEEFARLLRDNRVTGDSPLQEGALEFLLMLLERRGKDPSGLARHLLDVRNPGTAAVCFAAPKMGAPFQRFLREQLVQARGDFLSLLSGSRRQLFAWLTFVERGSRDVFAANERLELLRAHYQELNANGLSGYYFAVAAGALEEAPDTATVRACLTSLDGCERARSDLAEPLAERAVQRLTELNEAGAPGGAPEPLLAEKLYSDIALYLAASGKALAEDYGARSKGGRDAPSRAHGDDAVRTRWKRTFFREWVLHAFARVLVGLLGPAEAYRFLERKAWYRQTEPPELGLEQTREANIAIGSYFHWRSNELGERQGPGAAFFKLIDELVSSRKTARKITAFHLIRHTRATYGDLRVSVSPVFRPFLLRLRADEAVARLPAFRALFEETFGPNAR